MDSLKEYFNVSERWLPCIGKAPRRIQAPSTDWNVLGNQYSAKQVYEYKKDNPAMGWGTVVFKNDPIIVIDIDGLTDAGQDYIELHKSLPLMQTEVSTVLSKISIKDTLVERSLSKKGLHIYLLLDEVNTELPALLRYNNSMEGLCDHIEVFNGGSNEDDSKGKFIVFTGDIIKDFTLDLTPAEKVIEAAPVEKSTLIYTDVETLPTYTRKTTDKKLLDMLLEDEKFKALYTRGEVINYSDIDTEKLTAIREEELDTSKKVYRLVSILVANCQHFKSIDNIFKGSFFYLHTHWGLDHKWERLIAAHNNSNPILSAYNTKVSAARASGKPDYAFFKSPYTTEVYKQIKKEDVAKHKEERAEKKAASEAEKEAQREEKERIKEEKERLREQKQKEKELAKALKEQERLDNILRIKNYVKRIIKDNEPLYTEYIQLDPNFEVFDTEYINEEIIEDNIFLSDMFWKLFPYIFEVEDSTLCSWVRYNSETKLYEVCSKDELAILMNNFYLELFPLRSYMFREGLTRTTIKYYRRLRKPQINIAVTNSFLQLTTDNKGYYYKVKNGILDVIHCKLIPNTPNFLSFNELPFEIDEGFIEALKSGEYKTYLQHTLFFKFLNQSFPTDYIKNELISLMNNQKLIPEEFNKYIFKMSGSSSNYRFSHQIKVLQRMLGYTIIPRHILNSDKALILYGVAGSGKSTLAKLLGYLLTGKKDLSGLTTSFSALERNQYALAPFKTAPILVVNELPDKFTSEIRGTLNSLISGESVDINEKFRPNYSMQLPAKIVLIGNVLPKISDNSGSIARRSVIVNFAVNVSKTENAIANIDDKLIEPDNLKAFFLFCISGALEVLKHNYTVISKIGLDLLSKMEQQNNPIEDLLRDTIEFITPEELKEDLMKRHIAVPRSEVVQHIKNYVSSSYNNTVINLKTISSLGNLVALISDAVAKHFNQPEYVIHCKVTLGRDNKYRKHGNIVEVIRGIRLKQYVPELVQDLQELKEGVE